MSSTHPIGIFDSGVGGLSILRHIRQQMPQESLLYLADQAHVPYGPRSDEEVFQFSRGITQYFLAQQVKLIVVACNRASAAALTQLRQTFPNVCFVGMEPAVKPATEQTRNGKVGVLATVGTLESERYGSLMARFGQNVTVWEDPCLGLVELIEAGETTSAQTEQLLRRIVAPMLAEGIDTLVLGCTHYPFVRPLLEQIIGPSVTLIDPAPAVARQMHHLLQQANLLAPASQDGQCHLVTTARAESFARLARQLIAYEGEVGTAVWENGENGQWLMVIDR